MFINLINQTDESSDDRLTDFLAFFFIQKKFGFLIEWLILLLIYIFDWLNIGFPEYFDRREKWVEIFFTRFRFE